MNKSFKNHQNNGILLRFPNGNSISSIWGQMTHTENAYYKKLDENGEWDINGGYLEKLESNDVECMVCCSAEMIKKIQAEFTGNIDWYESEESVLLNNINIIQWIKLINLISS